MCYIIAKDFNKIGCIATKVENGPALASLVIYLSLKTIDKGIQIITLNDMDMFGEYKPYHMVASEAEFVKKVLEMK